MQGLKSLLSTITDVTKQRQALAEELSGVAHKIDALDAKISELMGMPLNLQDYFSFLKEAIEDKAKDHMHRIGFELLRSAGGCIPHSSIPLKDVETGVPLPTNFLGDGALCSYFGEHIFNMFVQRAEAEFGDKWGNKDLPTLVERRELIADYKVQKEALIPRRDHLQSELHEIDTALRG